MSSKKPREILKKKIAALRSAYLLETDPTRKVSYTIQLGEAEGELAKLNMQYVSNVLKIFFTALIVGIGSTFINRNSTSSPNPNPTITSSGPSTTQGSNTVDPSSQASPASSKEFYEIGKSKYIQGNYLGAIKDYDQAIELESNISEKATTFFSRGQAYHRNKTFQKAIEDYDQAIKLKKDDCRCTYYEAYWWRGNAYHHLGKIDAAYADYKTVADSPTQFAQLAQDELKKLRR